MNRQTFQGLALALMIGASATALNAQAQTATKAKPAATKPAQPWLNPKLDPDTRADLVVEAMTQDEKLTLVFGYFGADMKPKYTRIEGSLPGSAGYVKGIPRLGIPEQWETDAGVGVATQGSAKEMRERTALPSGIATTATWNPELAYKGGAMIGSEARNSGFNVMLAGGVNLTREPRNGRNFEYLRRGSAAGRDQIGAQIKGVQSNHIVSTIKHFAINNQEVGPPRDQTPISATPRPAQSDLLAFQIAIEEQSASVMCAYNKVNSDYACQNDFLLNKVLKKRLELQGLRDVGLGRGAQHGEGRARGPRPAVGPGAGHFDKIYFGDGAEGRRRQGRGQPGPRGRHGPPHPAG
jgi:beta-glucosidase